MNEEKKQPDLQQCIATNNQLVAHVTNLQLKYNDLQKAHEYLLDRVRRMRGYQREFFKYHAKGDLERSKALEREVDKMVNAEIKVIQSKQKDLF